MGTQADHWQDQPPEDFTATGLNAKDSASPAEMDQSSDCPPASACAVPSSSTESSPQAPGETAETSAPADQEGTSALDQDTLQPGIAELEAMANAGSDTEYRDCLSKIESLTAEITQLRADKYNLNQEYSAYVRRAKTGEQRAKIAGQKAVLQVLLGVLDDIYAARTANELTGPFAAIATKLEKTLETNFQLVQYGQVADPFDPNLHEALLAQESQQVQEPEIAQVLQPGYKLGEEVLRATKVIVNNPA